MPSLVPGTTDFVAGWFETHHQLFRQWLEGLNPRNFKILFINKKFVVFSLKLLTSRSTPTYRWSTSLSWIASVRKWRRLSKRISSLLSSPIENPERKGTPNFCSFFLHILFAKNFCLSKGFRWALYWRWGPSIIIWSKNDCAWKWVLSSKRAKPGEPIHFHFVVQLFKN